MPMRFSCLLGLILMTLTSCYKSKPTTLRVEVKTISGSVVSEANVKVMGVPPDNSGNNLLLIDYEEATNGDGIAFFNLDEIYQPGQSGVAIVEVTAQKSGLAAVKTAELREEIDNRVELVLQ